MECFTFLKMDDELNKLRRRQRVDPENPGLQDEISHREIKTGDTKKTVQYIRKLIEFVNKKYGYEKFELTEYICSRSAKSNLSHSAPDTNDDSLIGYTLGSLWIDRETNNVYVATDVTPGAAIWSLLTDESIS